MRKLILFGITTLVITSTYSQATPVLDQRVAAHSQVAIKDFVPLGTVSFDSMPELSEGVKVDSSSTKIDTSPVAKWTPSWLSHAPKRWWYSLHGWNDWVDNPRTRSVPEPATMLLFGSVLAGFAMVTRRKMKK